jgi:hypothetical protein
MAHSSPTAKSTVLAAAVGRANAAVSIINE